MVNRILWIVAAGVLGAGLGSCGASSSDSAAVPSQLSQPNQPDQPKETAVAIAPPQTVKAQTLAPKTYRVTLDDLPAPYATDSASKPPNVIPIPDDATLSVPEGFEVTVFAENLDRPRWLALTPEGDVLVTETRQNRIRRLQDRDHDGVAEAIAPFANGDNGLNIPFGMAFAGDFFFLGNTDEVRRYPYPRNQGALTGTGEKIADLPGGGYNQHWTRNVVAAPSGDLLYVSIGSRSNVDEENSPRATVQIMNLDGSNMQTFASGLRNPVGLAFHPVTRELYTTVNERDGLGDDLVPDYFTRIRGGEFFGWPWVYLRSDLLDPRHIDNGQSTGPGIISKTRTPDVLFQSHSAALGLQFYGGDTFPEPYRNGAFAAFRGSWNRDRGTGYKIVFIPFNRKNRPTGNYQDFLTGFLIDPVGPTTWGRPVGLLILPDGSLLFTEEANGRIYRVQYRSSRAARAALGG